LKEELGNVTAELEAMKIRVRSSELPLMIT
jgi:hypothetical protein